jgi:hypothetical protein
MKIRRVAIAPILLLLLFPLIPTPTPIYAQGQAVFYSDVVNWLGWVVELNISTSSTLTLGTVAPINISMTLRAKGQGECLHIVSTSITLATISVSRYAGFLRSRGDSVAVVVQIPLSSISYSQGRPGSSIIEFLKIGLQGYVEHANGTRYTVSFTKPIPITIYIPPSTVIAFMDYFYVGNRVQLVIRLHNFDVHPAFNAYLAVYVNGSFSTAQYYSQLEAQSQTTFSHVLTLKPGLYHIRAVVNYTTAYGVSNSFSTSTIVIIPTAPKISIKTNATAIVIGQGISIEGFVEPKAPLGLVLEYSLNGFDWLSIASLEAGKNGSFRYVWKPSLVGTVYLRVRSIETERFSEGVSNVLTVSIAKRKPGVKLSADKTVLSVGDSTRLTVSVTPNASLPIVIMYRKREEHVWRNYSSLTLDPSGRAAIPTPFFSEPGTYIFKALALETSLTEQSESNEIAITVYMPSTTSPPPPQGQQESTMLRDRATVFAVIVSMSIAIALLLLARGKRK